MHSYCHQQDPLQCRSRTDLHQHFMEGVEEAFKEEGANKEEEAPTGYIARPKRL